MNLREELTSVPHHSRAALLRVANEVEEQARWLTVLALVNMANEVARPAAGGTIRPLRVPGKGRYTDSPE